MNAAPLRILHVIPNLTHNGVFTFVYSYYHGINRDKVQFDFLYDGDEDSELRGQVEALGGRCYKLPGGNGPSFLWSAMMFGITKLWRYRVVHVHKLGGGLFFPFLSFICGVRMRIFHAHSTKFEANGTSFLKRMFYRIMVPVACFFSTDYWGCSNEAGTVVFGKTRWMRFGFLVRNAINPDKFRFDEMLRERFRREIGVSNETIVVVHIGNLYPPKNPAFLIDVFAAYHRRNKESILVSCGKNMQHFVVEAAIMRNKVADAVKLLGVRHDISCVLSGADVLLFPSIFEGLPMTVVEAQANGLPIVASTAVPDVAVFNPNVQLLDLRSSTLEKWADAVERHAAMAHLSAEVSACRVRDSKYDISRAAQEVQSRYLRVALASAVCNGGDRQKEDSWCAKRSSAELTE